MTQDIEQLNKTFDQAFYNQSSPQRCEYCGTNMQANCHAHSKKCPYYCSNEQNNLPIGDGLFPLVMFLLLYSIIKIKRNNYGETERRTG